MSAQRRERKVVTVVFCDLVGFTSRAESLDPEDVEALLRPYHERVRSELERHGGTVEKFIGDAVMALFGAPTAHEDDPERAVRAALAIREFAVEEGLELRVGITTGEALVRLDVQPGAGEGMASGDVVNTAARLQSAAPVNGILVSQKTYEATRQAIEFREARPVEAKGKSQPVPVWEVLAPLPERLVTEHETPLVGREYELELLRGTLSRAVREATAQLVTIVGVPGIGKSRLVKELSRAASETAVCTGHCLAYGDATGVSALAEIVRQRLDLADGDPSTAERLADGVTDLWIVRHLRPLLGLEAVDLEHADREETFTAWRRFLERAAEDKPLIVVFEDLHSGTDEMLDFVDHLVDWATGVPILVVCTARPELFERRPAWGGGKPNAVTISLAPLAEAETERLLSELLGQLQPDEDLVVRTGGNPLYAEQYARMLVERADPAQLPETVHGIVAARLDLLEPEQKALLQDAAVVGTEFSRSALAAMTGLDTPTLERRLHELERKEFVRRGRQSSIAGHDEYSFRHVLIPDVAYAQIPRAERLRKHVLVADWLESVGHDERIELLAHHYLTALELGKAAGLDVDEIAGRARLALREAGNRALALNANSAAERCYRAAIELWPADDPGLPRLMLDLGLATHLGTDELRLDLLQAAVEAATEADDPETAAEAHIGLALARRQGGDIPGAAEELNRAASVVADAPPSRVKAHVLCERARLLSVSLAPEAVEAAREALAMAEALELPALTVSARNSLGMAKIGAGDPTGMDDLDLSVRDAVAYDVAPFELARTYNNAAVCAAQLGRLQQAGELLDAALEVPATRMTRFLRGVRVEHVYTEGRWVEASQAAGEFLAEAAEVHALEFGVRCVAAGIALARDDLEGADRESGLALTRIQEVGETTARTYVLTTRAAVLLAQGRRPEADALMSELIGLWSDRLYLTEVLPTTAWVLVQLDRASDVELLRTQVDNPWLVAARLIGSGRASEAAELLGEIGALGDEAYARLQAGSQLLAEGRRAESEEQAAQAIAFYRTVGATRYVRQCEELLAKARTA